MQYSLLGKSAIKISEISFGCMSLPEDQKTSTHLLRTAYEAGINFFDTADLYQKGENEKMVGTALKEIRAQVVISSKVGNQWRPDGSGWDWNPRKDYILEAVEASLRRLQTDYLDLYQLHGGTLEDPIDDIIHTFENLKQTGKIREYGISSIRPNVIRAYVNRAEMASVMMQYSLLDRRPEETCLELLQKNGVRVLARGTLAQGLLAGKNPKPYLGYSPEKVQQMTDHLQQVAGQRSAATVATRFALYQPAVATAVLGIRTPEQLQEALVAGHTSISEAEWLRLKDILPPNFYDQHR